MSLHRSSRRAFLGQASCAAVGSSSLFSTIFNLAMSGNAAAADLDNSGDYKALVCLFLAGGNDSYNMLVPLEAGEYGAYKSIRADLALDGSTPDRTPLPITDPSGRAFGVHPSLGPLRELYNSGRLAFIANAGTLVQPATTLDMYRSGIGMPLGLFSHSDQIQQWQTSVPDVRVGKGWAGRLADVLHPNNAGQQISMNISLSGTNVLQNGNNVIPYSITSDGSIALGGYNGTTAIDQARTAAVNNMLDYQYSNLFEDTYVRKTRVAVDASEAFAAAVAGNEISTVFPTTDLGLQLRMVARTIKSHAALGHRRQTFFVQYGGWDHHSEVLNSQTTMLAVVADAVKAFHDALVELNMLDKVTLFQNSDFGRTLTTNNQGSDHAWGGNYFVMGGAVNGGRIYGDYPDFRNLTAIDTGRGRLIPGVSVDEYAAELARWFGVQKDKLADVLPNIGRFYNPQSNSMPIGFLS